MGRTCRAPHRGVRIPGAAGPVPREHLVQPIGVVGQVFEPHRTVFDEGHGLSVALHRHHDVETCLADLPHRALLGRPGRFHDRVRQAEVTQESGEGGELPALRLAVLPGELDEEERFRRSPHEPVHHRPVHGDVAGEVEHGAVHQLDRGGIQAHDVPGCHHRPPKRRKVADPEHPVGRDRLKTQLQPGEGREGTLRPDQQGGEVVTGRVYRIEIVSADAAEQLGKSPVDGVPVARGDAPNPREEVREGGGDGFRSGRRLRLRIPRDRPEPPGRAVGQQRLDRVHVVDHVPVADRACPAAIVAGHAPEGRTAAGGYVHGGRRDRAAGAPG